MLTLEFTKRSKGKNDTIRQQGNVPAVFYGPKEAATPISINEIAFKKVWKEAGESSIINLKGEGEEHDVLIKQVDLHPVSDKPIHADFYVIEKGKKLKVNVPIEFTGVSGAVKDLGGILVQVLREVEIEAMPKDLPHHIAIDISALSALDSQILAKDIKLPAGVELMASPEEVVAAISVAKEEVEEAAPVDISNIEIAVEKGKKEEEGAPAEESSKE